MCHCLLDMSITILHFPVIHTHAKKRNLSSKQKKRSKLVLKKVFHHSSPTFPTFPLFFSLFLFHVLLSFFQSSHLCVLFISSLSLSFFLVALFLVCFYIWLFDFKT